SIWPAAKSAVVFITGLPSGRIHPLAILMRSTAFTVLVDSQARYVPARPAACARAWQRLSAPAMPPKLAVDVVEVTNTMFAGVGLNVAVIVTSALTVVVQVLVPLQFPPDQPANDPPAVGDAVNVTEVPALYACVQS